MTELKTLKDLEKYHYPTPTTNVSGKLINSLTLKTEAVKWVKWIIKKQANPFDAFIKFHNITEEDLK